MPKAEVLAHEMGVGRRYDAVYLSRGEGTRRRTYLDVEEASGVEAACLAWPRVHRSCPADGRLHTVFQVLIAARAFPWHPVHPLSSIISEIKN